MKFIQIRLVSAIHNKMEPMHEKGDKRGQNWSEQVI